MANRVASTMAAAATAAAVAAAAGNVSAHVSPAGSSMVVKRVLFAGLGNLGFPPHLHSVSHLVLDELARRFGVNWKTDIKSKGMLATLPPLLYQEPLPPQSQRKRKQIGKSHTAGVVEPEGSASEHLSGETVLCEDSVQETPVPPAEKEREKTEQKEKGESSGSGSGTTLTAISHVEILLYKPSSLMGNVGPYVKTALRALEIPREDFFAVHDELDKHFGEFSLKNGGSAGGHNGVKSVTSALQTDQYRRLRIGIGRPDLRTQVQSFLLTPIAEGDMAFLEEQLIRPAGGAILQAAGVNCNVAPEMQL